MNDAKLKRAQSEYDGFANNYLCPIIFMQRYFSYQVRKIMDCSPIELEIKEVDLHTYEVYISGVYSRKLLFTIEPMKTASITGFSTGQYPVYIETDNYFSGEPKTRKLVFDEVELINEMDRVFNSKWAWINIFRWDSKKWKPIINTRCLKFLYTILKPIGIDV